MLKKPTEPAGSPGFSLLAACVAEKCAFFTSSESDSSFASASGSLDVISLWMISDRWLRTLTPSGPAFEKKACEKTRNEREREERNKWWNMERRAADSGRQQKVGGGAAGNKTASGSAADGVQLWWN